MRPGRMLLLGVLVLLLPTVLVAYLTMPFPGSQGLDSLRVAWWLHRIQPISLAIGAIVAIAGATRVIRHRKSRRAFLAVGFAVLISAGLLYGSHRTTGSVLFRQPAQVIIAATPPDSLPPESLVLGVVVNGHARAYPVRLLAYHHFVIDDINGIGLMPTY